MSQSQSPVYEFGPYRLEESERRLLRDGQVVALTPKAFDTLVALVENHGHVLSKEELLHRVWPGTFVEEATLAQNIFTLRRALNESGQHSYIETVPKRGYRFTAPVRVFLPSAVAAEQVSIPVSRDRSSRTWPLVLVVLLAGAAAASYFWRTHWRTPPASPAQAKVMLLVLPFENLSGNPQEYFSEGLTEEVIATLSRLNPKQLGVIARTTAMHYAHSSKSVAEIAQELEVDYVVEGSVRREGQRVRVTAQLVEARHQAHLWSQIYEYSLESIFKLQRELAQSVADEVRVQLAARTHPPPPRIDPEAYECYLRGRHLWSKRSGGNTERAREYFRQAIYLEPDYAAAHAALAETYAGALPQNRPKESEASLRRALKLDEELADAHVSQAIFWMQDFRWAEAQQSLERALELDPNSANARVWHAVWLQAFGRTEEAVEQCRLALRLDPLSPVVNQALGTALYLARRQEEAVSVLERTTELDADFYWAPLRLAQAYTQKGMYAEAEAAFLAAGAQEPRSAAAIRLAHTYAVAGRSEQARQALLAMGPEACNANADCAAVHLVLGETDRALEILENNLATRDFFSWTILVADPRFDPLRPHPRYADLLRRAGLRP